MTAQLPLLPDVERLSPRVIRILGGNPGKFALQGTNTYLLGTGPSRILIDTGEGFPLWRTNLAATLHAENATVSHALLTHWHHDHVSGVPDLLSLCPNARVYKHSPEHAKGQVGIEDGDSFEAEGARVRAWWCPGHTEDHVVFVTEDEGEEAGTERVMFTGDNVLGHGTAVFEDLEKYLSSLGRMRDICRGVASGTGGVKGGLVVGRGYPGHGAVVEDCGGKIEEYIRHRRQREKKIMEALVRPEVGREGLTPLEIVRLVYKSYSAELHEPARKGVLLILRKLEREGKVSEGEGGRWRVLLKADGKVSGPAL